MGYLSCKAQSSVSIQNPSKKPQNDSHSDDHHSKKPIKIQQFHYSDLEAATNGFSETKLLGKGSHGYVYKAFLHGRHVAIKKSSKGIEKMAVSSSEVDNEIEILSKIQSPRLVNLVGFSNDSYQNRILVVEFMSNGTLYDVLHSNVDKTLNWGRRIRLALQVAKAVETLHSQNPPIIHRDIKSANVLIDRNFNARLGDFGLALRCPVDDYKLLSTPPAGTMGYLDPLYVTPDNLSTKTDVFSFGILLLEIISGRKAIDVGHSPPSIIDWAIPLIRRGKLLCVYDPRIAPPRDPVVRKQLAVIAAKCVRSCRERRPGMKEIVGWLTGLSKLVPLHSWNHGFNNPCMMVETMGRPVESTNHQVDSRLENGEEGNLEIIDGRFARSVNRNSRRVYSDLGFRSDLMDLMANTDDEREKVRKKADQLDPSSKLANRVFSSRFGSARYAYRKDQPHPHNKDSSEPHGKKESKNVPLEGSSANCSTTDGKAPPRTSLNSHIAGDVQ